MAFSARGGAGEHALQVVLCPEPDHMLRPALRIGIQLVVQVVEGLVPGPQRLAAVRVKVGFLVVVPRPVAGRGSGIAPPPWTATTPVGTWRRSPTGSWPAGSHPGPRSGRAGRDGVAVRPRRSTARSTLRPGAGSATTGPAERRSGPRPTPRADSHRSPGPPGSRLSLDPWTDTRCLRL
jgi:hypothetical protein